MRARTPSSIRPRQYSISASTSRGRTRTRTPSGDRLPDRVLNTIYNLVKPGDTIRRYGGFGEFFAHEFFPYKDPTDPEYTHGCPTTRFISSGRGWCPER